ncbi:hypothetical protein [Streptomyces drozdowiczii]|uniref:SpdB2 protein n=1 Tax=Streptomyces drozdowiczii TaxID=202862 RepID=A0ABY6PQJ2_9ACTN|nr:hypothetical protein [Streptomyces drozdowiczii]MCX0246431.1 hypothetical protein [Streptomyces drozdowiczii]UZK54066.1 hypothetical protein NEH16_07800 [Streptomyces drozdowiczii]
MHWPRVSPLVYPAAALSAASLAWTTWSLVDLLGTGLIGLTVAAGADVVWASVIAAEARGLRVAGKRWIVTTIGWAALLAVAGLLVWHGIRSGSVPVAAAGPLLPLGAKVVWLLALVDGRDPAALTDDEQAVIARMERGLAFEEARHRVEMRRREMDAELQLAEVDVDFRIERDRQDKGRELARRAPIAIAPVTPEQPPITASTPPIAPAPAPAPTSASIADLARDHVAIHATNLAATEAICSLRPDADRPSVAAAVRRARRNLDGRTGGYG